MRYLFSLMILWLCAIPVDAQVKFASPLAGTPGQDYWIVNYVDHDATTGLNNYACGNKTYDGHEGTDFLIRSFKTMDSGVVVYAAADGIVFKTKDSLFDRSKDKNNLGLGNYVAINHSDELFAYYGHLKKHSLLVKLGDTVKEGQPIGLIGSSGNSTDPHLHLEVYDIKSKIVDPYAGPCQTATNSVWKAQPAYDTSLIVIDKGFTPYAPNLDTLRERYDANRTVFFMGTDTAVNFWIQLQGVRKGDVQRVDWYDTSGALYFSYSYTTPADYWYYYFWTYINIPPVHRAGVNYNAKYYINNVKIADENFTVPLTVGVKDVENNTLSVHPNPTNGVVVLHANRKNNHPYSLFDLNGKEIRQYPKNTDHIDMKDLPLGTYLLKQGKDVIRIIKE